MKANFRIEKGTQIIEIGYNSNEDNNISNTILNAMTEEDFRKEVENHLKDSPYGSLEGSIDADIDYVFDVSGCRVWARPVKGEWLKN